MSQPWRVQMPMTVEVEIRVDAKNAKDAEAKAQKLAKRINRAFEKNVMEGNNKLAKKLFAEGIDMSTACPWDEELDEMNTLSLIENTKT